MKKKKILIITPVKHIQNFIKTLKIHFNIKIFENPTREELDKIIHNFEIIFTNPNMSMVRIDENLIRKGNRLKAICTASTGTNHIDLEYAHKKKIKVISLRKQTHIINKISSTAEHALALMMTSIRNIPQSIKSVKNDKWDYRPFIGRQLNQLKVGVVGYGRLGRIFTNLVSPLAKEVLIYEKNKKVSLNTKKKFVSLDYLIKNSDVISLHIHADKSNLNFINKTKLDQMKKNVLLVNTSRGEIINENHLVNFLKKNHETSYATDVISSEIEKKFNSPIMKEFKKNSRIIITPHIGGMTKEAQEIAYNSVVKILIKKLNQ